MRERKGRRARVGGERGGGGGGAEDNFENFSSPLSLSFYSPLSSTTMKLAAASNARAAVSARSSVRAATTPAATPSRRSVGAALFAAVPAVMLAAAQPGEFGELVCFSFVLILIAVDGSLACLSFYSLGGCESRRGKRGRANKRRNAIGQRGALPFVDRERNTSERQLASPLSRPLAIRRSQSRAAGTRIPRPCDD